MSEAVKCLIIGSGPAGYTAAIYASRANLRPVLCEGVEPGGQLTTTTDIENFPGYPGGISGFELMEKMKEQARKFGADIRPGVVTAVDFSRRPFRATVDGRHEIEAETVIIATGATAKYLGLESEQRFRGMGVSACATCDGFFYRGRDVAVVGGGDTACEEALYLSTICTTVYMVVRKDRLRASKVMQKRVMETPNIRIMFGYSTKLVTGGETGVGGIVIGHADGHETTLDISGLFIAIGHHPNTEVFAGSLELDRTGYIVTRPGTTHTNIPGVFAAGDVRDARYRQAVSAAGSGCMAAIDAEKFLVEEEIPV